MASALEAEIDELLGVVSRASSAELCCWIAALWMGSARDITQQTGLSSPMRQLFYLQGVLGATSEPAAPSDLSKADYESIISLLNSIADSADSYVHYHFEAAVAGVVDARKAQTASLAFIQRYMSGAASRCRTARGTNLSTPYSF